MYIIICMNVPKHLQLSVIVSSIFLAQLYCRHDSIFHTENPKKDNFGRNGILIINDGWDDVMLGCRPWTGHQYGTSLHVFLIRGVQARSNTHTLSYPSTQWSTAPKTIQREDLYMEYEPAATSRPGTPDCMRLVSLKNTNKCTRGARWELSI